jgi:histone acetyltransferase
MPKARYQGLIKDYDGGTIMECYIHPSIDFTRIPQMVAVQKEFILNRIRATSKSDKVIYPPLPADFAKNLDSSSRASSANAAVARALAIPGVIDAGWTASDLVASAGGAKDADQKKDMLKKELLALVQKVQEKQFSWCFRDPVDTNEVTDYLEVVKDPIDLRTMEKRVRRGDHYKSKHQLYADMMKMVNNCKLYNDNDSTYHECAVSLEKFLATLFPLNPSEGGGD